MTTAPSPTLAVPAAQAIQAAEAYAGDIAAPLAWQWLQSEVAVLVDVRTDAEREWVGFVPGATPVAWKLWPGMASNPDFDAGLKAAVPKGQKVLFLCRSGVRSVAAATHATELGFEAYNIVGGFEGDADRQAQRGHLGGWRFQGLPWMQK
ncbi:rhodanese [Polaromonas sp.]|nr:rhodanese [Polaromonas sp.]